MFVKPINEQTSGRYVATVADQSGALVGVSVLYTATLSLFAVKTGAIVNGRNQVNILDPANGWTFYDTLQSIVIDGQTVTYNVAWDMTPADTSIVDDSLATEGHIAEINLTWAGGTRGVTHRFRLNVANFRTLT